MNTHTAAFRFLWKEHLIALAIFFVTVFIFCKPAFEGKVLHTTDGDQFSAMVENMIQVSKEQHNQMPLWNRNLFSGMPFFFDKASLSNPVAIWIFEYIVFKPVLYLSLSFPIPNPAKYFWLSALCFYILTCVLRMQIRVRIISSLVFAFSLQTSILVIAGHHTKLMSLAVLPLVIAGLVLIFDKKYFVGLLIGIMGLTCSIVYEHYQMIFYTLLTIAVMVIGYLLHLLKQKDQKNRTQMLWVALSSLVMVLVSFSFFVPKMMSYNEYASETIRSGSKIYDSQAPIRHTPKGLDKDYAFKWSYGIAETLTFIAPNVYGAASGNTLDEKSHTYQKLSELGIEENEAMQITKSFSTYWGEQPFTLGPIYWGVLVCILCILTLVFVRTWFVRTLGVLTLLTILIALGKHFAFLNYFLFDHLPLYNRFRAPTMIFTITQFSTSLLLAFGLESLFVQQQLWKLSKEKLYRYTLGICGVLVILLGLFYISASFRSAGGDAYFMEQLTQMTGGNKELASSLFEALRLDRKDMLWYDMVKFVLLCLALGGILYAIYKHTLKTSVGLILLGVVMVGDSLLASRQYIREDIFQEARDTNEQNESVVFPLSEADKLILADKDPNYRVLDLSSSNTFSDASASYYHRSVGGYYAAKLAHYQDLIDSQLSRMNPEVLNMLNTKYIITRGEKGTKVVQTNPQALGPCWFVGRIQWVRDTKQEMLALNTLKPHESAVVEQKYKPLIPADTYPSDPKAYIQSTVVSHDTMKYESSSMENQFAIFSEIFYDKTWKAYIDEKEVPIIKTNYVLRGLFIPKGKHEIVFLNKLSTYEKWVFVQTLGVLAFVVILGLMVYKDALPYIRKKQGKIILD